MCVGRVVVCYLGWGGGSEWKLIRLHDFRCVCIGFLRTGALRAWLDWTTWSGQTLPLIGLDCALFHTRQQWKQ